MAAEGRKPHKPPGGRDPFAPKPTAQRNFTDPESKIMKTSDGAFHQRFNAQAVVDERAQVILAADASAQAPDTPQLAPALDQLGEDLTAAGIELPLHAALTADAGYFSEDNVKAAQAHGLDPYIATGRQKHSDHHRSPRAGRSQPTPPPSSEWHARTRRSQGQATYARRKAIVEPVFGQMQTVQGARQLLIRG